METVSFSRYLLSAMSLISSLQLFSIFNLKPIFVNIEKKYPINTIW